MHLIVGSIKNVTCRIKQKLMRKIQLLLGLLFINYCMAGDLLQFKLEKDEKLQGTYTAEFSNNLSLHFVLIKNSQTKDFQLTPYKISKDNTVKKMATFSAQEMFNILSYHLRDGIVTIVNYDPKNKQLQLIDYDLDTGKYESSSQEMKTQPENVFRLKDKTVLVSFDKKQPALNIRTVVGANAVTQTRIAIPDDKVKIKLFRDLVDLNPDAVNQQEYVPKGSIAKRKGYLTDNHLVYTYERNREKTEVFNFDLSNPNEYQFAVLYPDFAKETKDASNYFYDNKLFFLGVEKQDIKLKAYDMNGFKTLAQMSLFDSKFKAQKQEQLDEYIKTALKSPIKSTITVNRTKANNFAVRLDNVKEDEYYYHQNWQFFFMQQQMMMQQQQFMQQAAMNSRAGFGPSIDFSNDNFLFETKKLPSLEFTITSDFTATTAVEETVFSNLDKESYTEKYKEDKTKKNLSFAFTDKEIRHISFNPKTKTISITSENL